jgi:hypothetical protein
MQKKDPAAVKLGRKGGHNSRKYLSEEESRQLAQRAAAARWQKQKRSAKKA